MATQQAFLFLIQSLFQIYIILVLLRCLLQIARADFYNPVSQAVVKLTQPLLHPLRRIIPSLKGIDMAALVLAFVLYLLMFQVLLLISVGSVALSAGILLASLVGVFYFISQIYFIAIIVGAITSWIPALQQHPITQLVWQLAEPVLSPFRRFLPSMGGLDLSPIFALLALQFLQILMQPMLLRVVL